MSWASDVLVYRVVLKVMLDLLTLVEDKAREFVGSYRKVLSYLAMWALGEPEGEPAEG